MTMVHGNQVMIWLWMIISSQVVLQDVGAVISANDCGVLHEKYYTRMKRRFCLGMVAEDWTYHGDGTNMSSMSPMSDTLLTQNEPNLGSVYRQATLREFRFNSTTMQCNWTTSAMLPRAVTQGNLAPTLRAVVGDTLIVYFKNLADETYNKQINPYAPSSMFQLKPQGLIYTHADFVAFNEEITYTWVSDEASAPMADVSSCAWSYEAPRITSDDSLIPSKSIMGTIVVVNPRYILKNSQRINAKPCDIDSDVYLWLSQVSETNSMYFSAQYYQDFGESFFTMYDRTYANTKYSINGLMFGSLEFSLLQHNRIRLHFLTSDETYDKILSEEYYMNPASNATSNMTDLYGPLPYISRNLTVLVGGNQIRLSAQYGGDNLHYSFNVTAPVGVSVDMQPANLGTFRLSVQGYEDWGMSCIYNVVENYEDKDDDFYLPDDGDEITDDYILIEEESRDKGDGGFHLDDSEIILIIQIVYALSCVAVFSTLVYIFVQGRHYLVQMSTYAACLDASDTEESYDPDNRNQTRRKNASVIGGSVIYSEWPSTGKGGEEVTATLFHSEHSNFYNDTITGSGARVLPGSPTHIVMNSAGGMQLNPLLIQGRTGGANNVTSRRTREDGDNCDDDDKQSYNGIEV